MQATETITLGSVQVDAAALAEICRRYAVTQLSVFGSAARNEMRADSDIDLLVQFQPEARVGLFKLGALNEELSDVMGRPVDLGTRLKPSILPYVEKDLRIIYHAD